MLLAFQLYSISVCALEMPTLNYTDIQRKHMKLKWRTSIVWESCQYRPTHAHTKTSQRTRIVAPFYQSYVSHLFHFLLRHPNIVSFWSPITHALQVSFSILRKFSHLSLFQKFGHFHEVRITYVEQVCDGRVKFKSGMAA